MASALTDNERRLALNARGADVKKWMNLLLEAYDEVAATLVELDDALTEAQAVLAKGGDGCGPRYIAQVHLAQMAAREVAQDCRKERRERDA
jgi:hypothetical protein